jgi:hypothetical protein
MLKISELNTKIDWLQIRLSGEIIRDLEQLDTGMKTKHFAKVYEYKKDGVLLWSLATKPYENSVLKRDMSLLKISNQFLYHEGLVNNTKQLIEWLGCKYEGITRLDLARDFQEFDNRYKPLGVINGLIKGKYLRALAGKIKAVGQTQVITGTNNHKPIWEYLRYNCANSKVSVYLYNKTKEMNQVKIKPWIIDSWGQLTAKIDVWRLEFSLKGQDCKYVNIYGELCTIDLDTIDKQHELNMIYLGLYDKYFKIYENEGKNRKDRNKQVKLINNLSTYHIHIDRVSMESNRSNRIFIKHLEKYNSEVRATKLNEAVSDLYVKDYSLEKYRAKVRETLILALPKGSTL